MRIYIKLGKRVGLTIRQLGYPMKNALKNWHLECEQRLVPGSASSALDACSPRFVRCHHERKVLSFAEYAKDGLPERLRHVHSAADAVEQSDRRVAFPRVAPCLLKPIGPHPRDASRRPLPE